MASIDGGDPEELRRLQEDNERLRWELASLRPPDAAHRSHRGHRARKIIAGVLVVLTSLCLVATALGVWVRRTLSSTDRYVALVAPLADDPAVTDALSVRLTDQVFIALDVEDRVEQTLANIPELPASGAVLAGPITSGARTLIQRAVDDLLASEQFADLWVDLNRAMHPKLVALLNGDEDELPNVSVNGGEVQLNLVSAVAAVIEGLAQSGVDALGLDVTIPSIPADLDESTAVERLEGALGVTLPDGFGMVTIMSADQLSAYQDTLTTAKRLLGALFVLSLLLLVLTVVVAPDRRRIVVWLAVGLVIATLLARVFLRRVEARVVDGIDGPGARAAAEDVFDEVRASLGNVATALIAVGVVVGVVAYLLGRPPWLTSAIAWARRVTTSRPGGSELEVWVAAHADPVRIATLAVAVVGLFITGIDWVPVAIAAVVVGLVWWGVSVAQRRAGTEVAGVAR